MNAPEMPAARVETGLMLDVRRAYMWLSGNGKSINLGNWPLCGHCWAGKSVQCRMVLRRGGARDSDWAPATKRVE